MKYRRHANENLQNINKIINDLDISKKSLEKEEIIISKYKSLEIGEINEETQFALNYFDIKAPDYIEKVEEGQKVILVDHNEFSQSVEGIEKAKIDTVVDLYAY